MTKKKAKVIYCHVKGTVYKCPPDLPRQRGTAPSCTLSLSLSPGSPHHVPTPVGRRDTWGRVGALAARVGVSRWGAVRGPKEAVQVAEGLEEVSAQEAMLRVCRGQEGVPTGSPARGWGGGQAEHPPRAAVSEGVLGVGVMGRGRHQGGHSYMAEPGESSGCPGGQCVPKALVTTQG